MNDTLQIITPAQRDAGLAGKFQGDFDTEYVVALSPYPHYLWNGSVLEPVLTVASDGSVRGGGGAISLGGAAYDQNSIATNGDSRLAYAFAQDGAAENHYAADNFMAWAMAYSQQRIKFDKSLGFAVAGLRSDQYMADQYFNQAFATKAYWLLTGGVANDIGQFGATGGLKGDGDYFTSYIKPRLLQWIASGRRVILMNETGSDTYDSPRIAMTARYNRQCAQFCRENPGGAVLWNVAQIVKDPAVPFAFRSGYSLDGTHLNRLPGVIPAAKAFAALVTSLMPANFSLVNIPGELFANGAVQWFPNPMFLTTTGGATGAGITGNVPVGITFWIPNTVAVAVSTAAGVYGNDMTLTLTASAAGSMFMYFDFSGISTTDSPGDVFAMSCEVDIAVGSSNLSTVALHIESQRGGVTTYAEAPTVRGDIGNFPTTAETLTLCTGPLTVQSGARNGLLGNFAATFTAAGSATIKLRRMANYRTQSA